MRKLEKALIVCIASLLLFSIVSSAFPPGGEAIQKGEVKEENGEIILHYSFEKPAIESGLQDFKRITIPRLNSYGAPGVPAVPFKTAKILIPYGEEVDTVQVTPGEKNYLGKFLIEPGQKPIPIGKEGEITPLNETIYNSMAPFPENIYSKVSVQYKKGYQILILNLYPMEYIPKSRDVSYFEKMTVVIKTKPAPPNELFRGLPEDREDVLRIVDNPEEMNTHDAVEIKTNSNIVPFFSQRNSTWKDDPIIDETGKTCGTIGNESNNPIGCAMTCTAMLLKYYGVDTDPGRLNAWLNDNEGYADGSDNCGALYWNKSAEYSNGKMQYKESLSWTSLDIAHDNDHWNELKNQLNQGYPVIVKVDANLTTPELESHWVLVTSFKGGNIGEPKNYYLNDPWNLEFDPEKNLSHYHDLVNNNTFFAMRVYHGIPSYNYVIITNEELKNAPEPNFQTLADWKNSRGVTTTIVTTEDIYSTYTGADNQEKIRDFIRYAYLNWSTEYVLLGGDADGENVGGEYENNMNDTLLSPEIDLTGVNPSHAAWFTFWMWYDSEESYDRCYVEISNDNFTSDVTELADFSGHAQGYWEKISLDISDYIGETVNIRFRFTSDYSITYEGFYIDDISIEEVIMTTILDEYFEGDFFPPIGWERYDYGDGNDGWNNNDWHLYNDYTYGWVARVYYSPIENQDEWLVTPTLDCSGLSDVHLKFWHYFHWYSGGLDEHGCVEGSIDNGTTWTYMLADYNGTDDIGDKDLNISSWAAGQSEVKIRWRYIANNDWYWYLDNVWVGSIESSTTIWEDDIESGASGWAHYAISGSDLWHLTTNRAHSGSHSWWCADIGGAGDNIVPVRELWSFYGEKIAADLYYACLDGDYDYDGDGIYGEPNDGLGGGEVDLMAEVYIGRAPVDSPSELSNFVNKTISYESTPISDPYLKDTWMVGELLWEDVPCFVEEAVYKGNVNKPEEKLNSLRKLRDNALKDRYVNLYYEYSPEITEILIEEPRLLIDAACLIVKYIPAVRYVIGDERGKDLRIEEKDVKEAISFTKSLKTEIKNREKEIGAERSSDLIKSIEEFEEQVNASKGKTFSQALQSSIYFEKNKSSAKRLSGETWGGDYKDEIKDGSCANGYCTVGFPDTYNKSTLYDRDYSGNDWPKSEIISIINSNVHTINHLGHANVGIVLKMYNSDVDALTNDKYFFGYSQGCYAGSFDNKDTGGNTLSYDCIIEHFVTNPTGAFGFIANSRYGWGMKHSTNGPSQHFDRQFWDAIFGEGITNVGKANQDSKEDNIGSVSDNYMRYCYYEINLLGDPETSIFIFSSEHDIDVMTFDVPTYSILQMPTAVNVTIKNRGLEDESNIEIQLLENGAVKDTKIIGSLSSGSSTIVNFAWSSDEPGDYTLGVYAVPVSGETSIENNYKEKFVRVVETYTVDDDGQEFPNANYTSIQGAINNANDGDIIVVYSGSYSGIAVDKTVNLVGKTSSNFGYSSLAGEEMPVIDGGGSGDVVVIQANNVVVKGFKIINSGNDDNAGIKIDSSNNVIIEGNEIKSNDAGIGLSSSSNNIISENIIESNNHGIAYDRDSTNNNIFNNNIYLNAEYGIYIGSSGGTGVLPSNNIYHNNFIDNNQNAEDKVGEEENNRWYNFNLKEGNYWSDYVGEDTNNDGIGDTPYNILGGDNQDPYSFMKESGWISISTIFDTGAPANPYPSIFGTHNGTIKPSNDITVHKLYTYSCAGTGGHTKYARIWNNSGLDRIATWNGYKDDWHNITFDEPFTLFAEKTYYYEIRTGSYPQIHHTDEWEAEGGMGIINCTSFVDANGKVYNSWIPAISLWS